MGMILRLFLFMCLLYLVVKLVKTWWHEDDNRRVQGDPKPQVRPPFDGTEIIDAKFTELPPDPEKDHGT